MGFLANILFGLILNSSLLYAAELHWVQLPGAPHRFVVATEEGQSREEALQSYIASLDAHDDLSPFVQVLKSTAIQDLRWGQIAPSEKKKSLLLANNIEDMGLRPRRVMNFQRTFEEAGAEVYVLPVAALRSVSSSQKVEVMEEINSVMDQVTAMGGDDISPKLYGRFNQYSENVIHDRDQPEAQLLSFLIEKGKVFVLGVCRGHQMVAVTQGFELYQDIPSLIKGAMDHMSDHDISLEKTKNNLLSKMTGFTDGMRVNSLHHQAVKPQLSAGLEIVALSEDGVVEAMELKNGQGLTVQFHPEMMEETWAKDLLKNSIYLSGSQSANKCSSLLSAS